MTSESGTLENRFEQTPFLKTLTVFDWLWAAILVAGSFFAWHRFSAYMDSYEIGILFGSAITLSVMGWAWKPLRQFSLIVFTLSLLGIFFYEGNLASGENRFFLKYFLASQSSIMWMSALFVMATLAYIGGLFSGSQFVNRVASSMTWIATTMGMTGLLVRWYESYLISPDVGHIPVSNLYEVFILFAVFTALIYLFYEMRYRTFSMGAFVLFVISAAVGFLLWYTFDRGAHEIQPLVPALQSYWMKIHVPSNFIGYGAFALAAMVAIAYLLKHNHQDAQTGFWSRLPSLEVLDDVMYKSIALGFAFFTIATVLGAMWAAEAWGGYWSWDPKETWALIVWLNYAGWLHMRLTKGWRGKPLAWWAFIGLFVTLFAFLGVNMFLSGLHSYGEL